MQQPRGKEYLDDRLIAEGYLEENKLALAQIQGRELEKLRSDVDTALALYLDAQDRNVSEVELKQFKLNHEVAELQFQLEQKKQAASLASTQAKLISGPLGRPVAGEEKKEMKSIPIARVFTDEEMKKINLHFEKIPENLRNLMEAALGEDINLGLAANPVFIRSEHTGHIYDRKAVSTFIKHGPATCPHNQDKEFSEGDIIPCNSLIKAIEILLNIINGVKIEEPSLKSTLAITDELKELKRARIPADIVRLIELNYYQMPLHHKALFNCICRDPITNIVMDDPVLLPDGYIYDRTTAMAYLKRKGGQCPLNSELKFTEADITPCLTVRNVLNQLRDYIIAAVKDVSAESDVKSTLRPA